MPNRIISPKICTSPELNEKGLTFFDEVVFYRLLVCCDANGRIEADAGHIRATLFPRKQNVTRDSIQTTVSKLQSVGLVHVYEVNGINYLQIARWADYQVVRSKGLYPDPNENDTDKNLVNNVSTICLQKEKDKESNKETEIRKVYKENNTLTSVKESRQFAKPSVEEIAAYCAERKNGIDAQAFYDFYESKGWLIGKSPMKDFRACVRTWEQRRKSGTVKQTSKPGFDLDEFFDLATGGNK